MASAPSIQLRAMIYGLQSLEEGEHWGTEEGDWGQNTRNSCPIETGK